MERTIDGGLIVANLFYAIENDRIEHGPHLKIAKSMRDNYNKTGFLTGNQINYLNSILNNCDIPKGLSKMPFRNIGKSTSEISKKRTSDRVVPHKNEDLWKVIFSYSSVMVEKVKSIPGRKYVKQDRLWVVPKSLQNLQMLEEWGFKIHPNIKKWKKSITESSIVKFNDIPGLKLPLLPFQKEGVGFIESRKGRVLIGDEMGLGKTPQALAWLQLNLEARPAVIVCPASLKWNWYGEAFKFMKDPKPQVIEGRPGKDPVKLTGEIIIINYDIIADSTEKYWTGKRVLDKKTGLYKKEIKRRDIPYTGWGSYLKEHGINTLILDECHMIKEEKSLRTIAIQKIGTKLPHVICLSGTPFLNRPVEIFSIINLVNPYIFPSFFNFAKRYCGAKKGRFGWDFKGATNKKELHDLLTSTLMMRRLKKDVLKELPEKVRSVIPLEITNRKIYERAEQDFISYLSSFDNDKALRAKQAEHLVKIGHLKKIAVEGKIKACIDWIDRFLETGEKLVVFTHHNDVIQKLEKTYGKVCGKIDGSIPTKKRQEVVDNFQKPRGIQLFLGNLEAASVGLTLTAASHTCFIEFPWSPGTLVQAEDRVHRIGQKSDSVNAWYLVARGTVEEDIVNMLERKSRVLQETLDGLDGEENGIFGELLEKLAKSK